MRIASFKGALTTTFMAVFSLRSIAEAITSCWVNGTQQHSCAVEDSAQLLTLLSRSRNHVLAPAPQQLVGCWIPKVGSRLIVRAMSMLTHCQQHPLSDCSTRCPTIIPRTMRNQCRGVTVPAAFTNASYFRFVVLRDPITRFLSGYLDKYSAVARSTAYHNFDAVDVYGGEETTWREYLNATAQQPTIDVLLDALPRSSDGLVAARNQHLKPQMQQCHLQDIRYDMYIDHAQLMQSLQALDRIAQRSTGLFELIAEQKKALPSFGAPHSTQADSKVCQYITPAIAQQLHRLYRSDYAIFQSLGLRTLQPDDVRRMCNTTSYD